MKVGELYPVFTLVARFSRKPVSAFENRARPLESEGHACDEPAICETLGA
jgi:hypothetical protein